VSSTCKGTGYNGFHPKSVCTTYLSNMQMKMIDSQLSLSAIIWIPDGIDREPWPGRESEHYSGGGLSPRPAASGPVGPWTPPPPRIRQNGCVQKVSHSFLQSDSSFIERQDVLSIKIKQIHGSSIKIKIFFCFQSLWECTQDEALRIRPPPFFSLTVSGFSWKSTECSGFSTTRLPSHCLLTLLITLIL
jgi:hypothetical protein